MTVTSIAAFIALVTEVWNTKLPTWLVRKKKVDHPAAKAYSRGINKGR